MAGRNIEGETAPGFAGLMPEPRVQPAQRLDGTLLGVFATTEPGSFVTAPVPVLELGLDGVAGDRHFGFTRASGSREPWYPHGTLIRSRRQLSVISVEEMAVVADRLGIPEIRPEWIGANLLISGVPRLSFLPSGTRLHLSGGAVVLVEHMNGPCRHAGGEIALHHPERDGLQFDFVTAAKRMRGVVASVDRPGRVQAGEAVEVRIPEHWVYAG